MCRIPMENLCGKEENVRYTKRMTDMDGMWYYSTDYNARDKKKKHFPYYIEVKRPTVSIKEIKYVWNRRIYR